MAPRRDEPLFTFRLVPLVAELCREGGVEIRPLLLAAGLPEAAAEQKEVNAPIGAFRQLLDSVARALDDDAFGLSLAARVPDGTYSLLEFGARSALTLREAFVSLSRFGPLVNAITRFTFEEDERGGSFEHRALTAPPGQGRELHEFTLARVLAIAREQVGEVFVPTAVWFSYPRPKSVARLKKVFGEKLEFGAAACGFRVPAMLLDHKLAAADPALKQWLDAQAEEALGKLPGSNDLSGRVRTLLSTGLSRGVSDMRGVAESLKMSERTLQRRLADEGMTFAKVLEQVRQALSHRYLADARLSVSEIAWLLGYSDLRAFDRAFLRWSGQTPIAWRRAQTEV